MNTNPNRHEAIEKLVNFSEANRLELLGYLLAKYPEITDTIIDFNPSQRCLYDYKRNDNRKWLEF